VTGHGTLALCISSTTGAADLRLADALPTTLDEYTVRAMATTREGRPLHSASGPAIGNTRSLAAVRDQ
jgi:hypothetical protein